MKIRPIIFSVSILSLTAFGFVGCASPDHVKGTLLYEIETTRADSEVHFPPPPATPRFTYAGELVGARNFLYEKPDKGFSQKFFEFITGVSGDSGKEIELVRPQAVTTDTSGRVFVSDVGLAAVFVFDAVAGEARLLSRIDKSRIFRAPSGIAIGDEGQVFVADADVGVIAHLDVNGVSSSAIGDGVLKRPTGLAFDSTRKRLIVSDTDESVLKVFNLSGKLLTTVGKPGVEAGEFNRPTHIAIWQNELYVTDTFNSRIQVFELDSFKPIRSIGSRGTYVGQLAIPKGVAVDSEGNVYVIESLFDHLLIFSREGNFLLPIGGTGYTNGRFYLPAGVWVDRGNRVYVADMYNGRVVTYLYLGSESETGD